jgi:group I intron endonuclease
MKCKKQVKLYHALVKYGYDAFDKIVLEECTPNEMNEREKYWIAQYNSFHDGYNLTEGGQGNTGMKVTDETRRLISERTKLAMSNPIIREKCREHANTRQPMSVETRQKCSEAAKRWWREMDDSTKANIINRRRTSSNQISYVDMIQRPSTACAVGWRG